MANQASPALTHSKERSENICIVTGTYLISLVVIKNDSNAGKHWLA